MHDLRAARCRHRRRTTPPLSDIFLDHPGASASAPGRPEDGCHTGSTSRRTPITSNSSTSSAATRRTGALDRHHRSNSVLCMKGGRSIPQCEGSSSRSPPSLPRTRVRDFIAHQRTRHIRRPPATAGRSSDTVVGRAVRASQPDVGRDLLGQRPGYCGQAFFLVAQLVEVLVKPAVAGDLVAVSWPWPRRRRIALRRTGRHEGHRCRVPVALEDARTPTSGP